MYGPKKRAQIDLARSGAGGVVGDDEVELFDAETAE